MHNVFTEMQSKLKTVTSFCQFIKQMSPHMQGPGKQKNRTIQYLLLWYMRSFETHLFTMSSMHFAE